MRARVAGAALLIGLLPQGAAAQLQEEDVQVPASPQTLEEVERAAEAADQTAAEALEESTAEAPEEGAAETPEEGAAETPEEGAAETPLGAWRDVAAPEDVERIEGNERAYGAALDVAGRAGTDADRAELGRILGDLPQPIDTGSLAGRWDCRTVRFVGEPADFRVYDWFPCQISELPQGLLLEKLGGSELTAGYLYPESETRMIYLGYAHGQAEPAQDYPGAAGPAERRDPAILTQRGPDRLLLAKPDPAGPADYDLLELRRR